MQCFSYPENFKISMEKLLPKIKELSKITVNKINVQKPTALENKAIQKPACGCL